MPPRKAPRAQDAPTTNNPLLDAYPQRMVALATIERDDKNHRLVTKASQAQFAELLESMRTEGRLLQPILVYPAGDGHFHLVFGNRRFAAAEILGWLEISAMVMDHVPTESEKQRLRAVENFKHAKLTPAEECVAVAMMVDACGGSVDQAAKELGMDPREVKDHDYVYQRLAPKTKSLLSASRINLPQARELAKIGDWAVQLRMADRISLGEDGTGSVVSAGAVRGMVENEKRSLRSVSWRLNVAFAHKPACAGCKDNTATDVTLFGTGDDEAVKGCCLNPGCYDVKLFEAEKAKTQAKEKIQKWTKEKRIDKDGAGSITIAAEASPAFLKHESVQRFVKKELGLGESKASAGKGQAKVDPKEEAKTKFVDAFYAWRAKIKKALKSFDVTEKRLAYRLLQDSRLWQNLAYHFNPTDTEKPISPKLAALIDHAAKACGEDIGPSMTALVEDANFNSYDDPLDSAGPELCLRVAKAFGIDCEPAPMREDLLPKKEGLSSEEINECLHSALHHYSGSAARWGTLRKNGCTDAELKAAIGDEFGIKGGFSGPETILVEFRGGKDPALCVGRNFNISKPTLTKQALVDAVRKLMQISNKTADKAPTGGTAVEGQPATPLSPAATSAVKREHKHPEYKSGKPIEPGMILVAYGVPCMVTGQTGEWVRVKDAAGKDRPQYRAGEFMKAVDQEKQDFINNAGPWYDEWWKGRATKKTPAAAVAGIEPVDDQGEE